MNLHLLRVFFEVVEAQSYTRAAVQLHISQPAVSKAVRELQLQVGLPLIESGGRGSKGVPLTDSGRALYEHARGIFALERSALEDIRARISRNRGLLTLGASTTVASYWLPDYLAAFRRRYPGVDTRIEVGNTRRIAEALIDCRVDIALVEGAIGDARIEASLWRQEPLCILTHPDADLARKKPLDRADLQDQLWLVREPGSGTREVGDRLRSTNGWIPSETLEIGSNEGIARTLAAGIGIAVLPERVVRELLTLKALAALHPARMDPLHRPLYRLGLRERPVAPLTSAFLEVLAQPLESG